MKRARSVPSCFRCSALIGIFVASTYAQAPAEKIYSNSYKLTDVGTLGGSYAAVNALNNKGHLTGSADTPDGRFPGFFWENGRIRPVGIDGINAFGINDRDEVVGSVELSGQQNFHAVVWREDGHLTDLGTLFGDVGSSLALSINNKSQIVGYSIPATPINPNGQEHATLWDGSRITDLGTLPGGHFSTARSINDRGQIVGTSETADGQEHTVLWQRGEITDIGTLGGKKSYPFGINNRGQVIGESQTVDGKDHAFVWVEGRMFDLNLLLGLGDTLLGSLVLNDREQLVGITFGDDNLRHPFLLDHWRMIDINSLLPPGTGLMLDNVAGINDRGQIAVLDSHANIRSFLMTPAHDAKNH
jgi:probable HAF family extracellular repeat protein